MNRVAITGIGVVSPVGCELEEYWNALVEGRSGIGPLTTIPTERLNTRIAAEVKNHKPEKHFATRALPLLDRFSQFAVIAARNAVADAGLVFDEELAQATATIVGSGVGGQNTLDDGYYRLYGQNAARLHPFTIPRLMVNAGASQVSMDMGLRGPTFAVASACASGTHAIGLAFDMVRSGRTAAALVGGAEACITVGTLKGWEALRVLSADTCRPFSRTRSGLVLGEGAAMLMLEPLDRAHARGARVYAEVRGFGMSADADDITAPNAEGSARALRAALEDARIPEEFDRLHQRPRHRHDAQRLDRNAGDPRRLWSACRSSCGLFHQGRPRAWAWRRRRLGGGRDGARHPPACLAADGEFRRAGSGVQSRRHSERRARSAHPLRNIEFIRIRRTERRARARRTLTRVETNAQQIRTGQSARPIADLAPT